MRCSGCSAARPAATARVAAAAGRVWVGSPDAGLRQRQRRCGLRLMPRTQAGVQGAHACSCGAPHALCRK